MKAGISTARGCSYEGRVPVDVVRGYAAQLAEAGADELLVADTVGYADPTQVRTLFRALRDELGPDLPIGAHFHDTRGTALANALVGLEMGFRDFDASVAGLGGCPYAPGASGNVPTENIVYMLNGLGIETGIDLDKLLQVAEWIQGVVGHPLASGGLRAYPGRKARAAGEGRRVPA